MSYALAAENPYNVKSSYDKARSMYNKTKNQFYGLISDAYKMFQKKGPQYGKASANYDRPYEVAERAYRNLEGGAGVRKGL